MSKRLAVAGALVCLSGWLAPSAAGPYFDFGDSGFTDYRYSFPDDRTGRPGFYDYGYSYPDYRDSLGYPYYGFGYRPLYRHGYNVLPDPNTSAERLSCREARRLLRSLGYRWVATRDCTGKIYVFRAVRGGRHLTLAVNARTGRVWRI